MIATVRAIFMTIIEVGFFATPILGAVGGAAAVRGSGALTTISALMVGAGLGIGVIALLRLVVRVWPRRLNFERPQWLPVVLAVFVIPVVLPAIAFLLSRAIVSVGVHL